MNDMPEMNNECGSILQFLSSSLSLFVLALALILAACSDNFVPQEKTAQYDPTTGELTLPHPCPDWSQSQTQNYLHQTHSNFGCAVNTNNALQVAEPSDLYRGHGTTTPDIETTIGVVQQYRAGKLPVPLVPQQDAGSGGVTQ